MSALLEAEYTSHAMEMTAVRQFALRQISSRLSVEPGLVTAFWNEIGTPAERPDLTVIYFAVRRREQIFALLEFVAGETLEQLVKRSDPAACEAEIPVFCRILDAFENAQAPHAAEKAPNAETAPSELEMVDFGVGRAAAVLTSRLHGAVLAGADGSWNEAVFAEYGASRSQMFAALMELCSKLPGNLPRTGVYGVATLGSVSARSLAGKIPETAKQKAAAKEATPGQRRSLVRSAIPYIIAIMTMALVLLTFYGVGGYLAKATVPADAGKLNLPPAPTEPAEPNLQITVPVEIPVAPKKQTVQKKLAAQRKKQAEPQRPIPSIMLTRGAKPLLQTSLTYPEQAEQAHVTGLVEMQFTIAADGSVQSPRVVSGDPLLRAGLAEEVSHWVYQPMKVNGKPVPMTTEMAIRFNLN